MLSVDSKCLGVRFLHLPSAGNTPKHNDRISGSLTLRPQESQKFLKVLELCALNGTPAHPGAKL